MVAGLVAGPGPKLRLAADSEPCLMPPELARIVDVWDSLPEAVRRSVVNLVDSAIPRRGLTTATIRRRMADRLFG
ncbi:hypothetical protein [Planctellipticum variicoloris]|uniref:hypothetical protein n=1 Tax=Planctellipticum variicoloris TaxID=3064265 RepID=UPI003013D5F7|nr:hypothetical protein SH412_002995 [Planctomycetaceae bacterium SH412]